MAKIYMIFKEIFINKKYSILFKYSKIDTNTTNISV